MTQILSRADFLSASKSLKREMVDLPGFGSVYLRELSTRQIIEYNERLQKLRADHEEVTPSDSIYLMALMVSMCACDEDGALLFTPADVKDLADSKPDVLIALSVKALELSGLGSNAIEEVQEELKKATAGDSSAIS